MKKIKSRTLLKFSAIAYQCVQETREKRPTITEVAIQLNEAMEIQLEDEISQDELHISGHKDETRKGELGSLKSKVKFRFCGCIKKQ
ncbi:hypothetical protein L1887_18285 [Cichorium endivia]|nr:hypothetical protein L1887_18285 [Cichorium endivia]